jgi:hypothetical protein
MKRHWIMRRGFDLPSPKVGLKAFPFLGAYDKQMVDVTVGFLG